MTTPEPAGPKGRSTIQLAVGIAVMVALAGAGYILSDEQRTINMLDRVRYQAFGSASQVPFQPSLKASHAAGLERLMESPDDELAPCVSPDGSRLAFARYHGGDGAAGSQIVVREMAGSKERVVSPEGARETLPSWGAEPDSLLLVRVAEPKMTLVRASISAGPTLEPRVLAEGALLSRASTRPGARIFVSVLPEASGESHVLAVSVNEEQKTDLGPGIDPALSPDGARLALSRAVDDHPGETLGERNHLFLVDPKNGQDAFQLTSGDEDQTDPVWSPDGKRIAFVSRPHSPSAELEGDVWVIGVDRSAMHDLTVGNSVSGPMAWGSDGWIYFASGSAGARDIWRVREH